MIDRTAGGCNDPSMGEREAEADASRPDEPATPKPSASFAGGIYRGRILGFGASAPFGHLDVDDVEVHIWGAGMDLCVRRDEVRGVRLSRGILSTRVRVVFPDGSRSKIYFASIGRADVRDALDRRGWPVIED